MAKKLVLLLGLFMATAGAYGQSQPYDYRIPRALSVGGFFDAIKPDYGLNTFYGFGGYFDYQVYRFLSAEGEARINHFNSFYGVQESTYLIGPRVSKVYKETKFEPYAKLMIGTGTFTYPEGLGSDHHTVYAVGGGLDYHFTPRVTLRADYEYQQWKFGGDYLTPYGVGFGASYRLF